MGTVYDNGAITWYAARWPLYELIYRQLSQVLHKREDFISIERFPTPHYGTADLSIVGKDDGSKTAMFGRRAWPREMIYDILYMLQRRIQQVQDDPQWCNADGSQPYSGPTLSFVDPWELQTWATIIANCRTVLGALRYRTEPPVEPPPCIVKRRYVTRPFNKHLQGHIEYDIWQAVLQRDPGPQGNAHKYLGLLPPLDRPFCAPSIRTHDTFTTSSKSYSGDTLEYPEPWWGMESYYFPMPAGLEAPITDYDLFYNEYVWWEYGDYRGTPVHMPLTWTWYCAPWYPTVRPLPDGTHLDRSDPQEDVIWWMSWGQDGSAYLRISKKCKLRISVNCRLRRQAVWAGGTDRPGGAITLRVRAGVLDAMGDPQPFYHRTDLLDQSVSLNQGDFVLTDPHPGYHYIYEPPGGAEVAVYDVTLSGDGERQVGIDVEIDNSALTMQTLFPGHGSDGSQQDWAEGLEWPLYPDLQIEPAMTARYYQGALEIKLSFELLELT